MVDKPAFQREPALQTKKRVASPLRATVASALAMDNASEASDYILLGNQNKFQTNVKYPLSKTESRRRGKSDTNDNNNNANDLTSPPPAPRNTPPKVIVDTGSPLKKTKPSKTVERPYKTQLAVAETQVVERDPVAVKSRAIQTVVPAAVAAPTPSKLPATSQTFKRQQPVQASQQRVAEKSTNGHRPADAADNDYALKYKHQVVPQRPAGPKRLSEYQRQYLGNSHDSPLLAADRAMRSVQPSASKLQAETTVPVAAIAPRKSRLSEYRSSYQPWLSPQKIKRSRSLESVQVDAAADKKPATRGRDVTQHPVPPRRSASGVRSEYATKYYEPAQYEYIQGAWHQAPGNSAPPAPDRSWFNEIIELRRRAAEYKKRAQGSHFSHEHLGQLFAQQAELWDSKSSIGGAPSHISSARDRTTPREAFDGDNNNNNNSAGMAEVVASKQQVNSAGQTRRYKHRPADTEGLLRYTDAQSVGSSRDRAVYDEREYSEEGSLTPRPADDEDDGMEPADDKTREVAVQTPVRDAGKVKKASTAAKASKKVNNGTVRSSVQNAAPLEPSSSASTLRTFGKPTSDTHVLVDDYADHSRPLVAKFLQTPQYLATVDTNGDRDDDSVSVASVRSLASSCSLASQTLDRARERRDNFWTSSANHNARA